jgi:hypothetical protein
MHLRKARSEYGAMYLPCTDPYRVLEQTFGGEVENLKIGVAGVA